MAERTVKIGLATFRRADAPDDTALWGFALLGESADVHKDDLERFDRLNAPFASEPVPLPKAITQSDDEAPAGNASLEDWQEYARSQGASDDDLEGKSRNDLRDEFGQ